MSMESEVYVPRQLLIGPHTMTTYLAYCCGAGLGGHKLASTCEMSNRQQRPSSQPRTWCLSDRAPMKATINMPETTQMKASYLASCIRSSSYVLFANRFVVGASTCRKDCAAWISSTGRLLWLETANASNCQLTLDTVIWSLSPLGL